MRRLVVFNSVSLDGFFVDAKGDMSWAHNNHPEFDAFVQDNARTGGELLFGRITYEMMAGFWPTPQAIKAYPAVAEGMNSLPKVVFSRTLDKVTWNNTKLVKTGMAAEIRTMKSQSGKDIVILGSGSIVSQLAQEGVIDEYQCVVIPVVLGKGRTMFDGVKGRINLRLTKSRVFANGIVFLCYERKA